MELIECVPNISEGRDYAVIDQIVHSIKRPGLTILHVDSGADAQRTVITMVGSRAALLSGVFDMIANARDLIDLNKHSGVHPYLGAVDVVPFIPLANCSMQDCDKLSRELAARVANELAIPAFLYAHSASDPVRQHLSFMRRGNFPALAERMRRDPLMQPDFGPDQPHPTAGAVVIGARPLMVAFNISLSTSSVGAASKIAELIRESGPASKNLRKKESALHLPTVKAIGWFVSEYNCAQVSTNIMDFQTTPLEQVFEAVKNIAAKDGIKVIGSQLVGLIPKAALLSAGRYYNPNSTLTEHELMSWAVNKLGLAKHQNFDIQERVLELRLEELGISM